ncbi:hypothetical protein BH09BAC2_BH09BAC2_06350 [soil metagenome]
MNKTESIGAAILGAAAAIAVINYLRMNDDERAEFMNHLKVRTHELIDDTEGTLNKIKHHFAEIDSKDSKVEKLVVLKNLVTNLFGKGGRMLSEQ